MTHQVGKRPLAGKAWRNSSTGDYTKYLCVDYDAEYKLGDSVYIESRPDQPFYICQIQEFKMSKGERLQVHIKWFYRTSEVPEQVYQLLVQDRHTEHHAAGSTSPGNNTAAAAAAIAAAAANATTPAPLGSPSSSSSSVASAAAAAKKGRDLYEASVALTIQKNP